MELSSDQLKSLNKRHFRGAIVRSIASICIWSFALVTYSSDIFKPFNFIGISATVLYLILMNLPVLIALRFFRRKRVYEGFTLFINQLEILGYTAVIYFSGGMESSYLVLFQGALIAYIGVVSSQKQSLIIATLCTLNFTAMISLIYFGVLPDTKIYTKADIPGMVILIQLSVIITLFYAIAFISATPAKLLRAHRDRLKQQNMETERVNRQLSQEIIERKIAEKTNLRLQAQLNRAQKMEAIGTLAGRVAHDLNNILAGLVGYPELLLLDLPADSPLRGPLFTIQKSGEKVAAIVQDLLTLSRRERNVMEVLNLNDIVSEYFESPEYQKLISYHSEVRAEIHLEPDLLNILGSPVHLSKVVMNLVSNAVEAMPEGGPIIIATENRYIDIPIIGYEPVPRGDYVILTVSDRGIGMSSEDMDKIFEPFYTKKTLGKSGTGLGMTVVWGTVKDHEGYIDVRSEESKGTSFTLYFPVTRKALSIKKPQLSLKDYSGHGETILLIDDDQLQREIGTSMLEKLNYTVHTVSSGEKAVEYLRNNPVDLLILDMIMNPGLDGLETYERIIEMHPGQRAIIASGFSETERVIKVQKLGAGAYIRKPYTLEKIGLAIKAELSKPK